MALAAKFRSIVTGKPEVIPGQKSAYGKCAAGDLLEARFGITVAVGTTIHGIA
jgi:hypothetical protein